MKQFKLGLAVVLSFMTALVVITANSDKFLAIGGNLGFAMAIATVTFSLIAAIPVWLMVITSWQKLHHSSYLQFKNWCGYQANELMRP